MIHKIKNSNGSIRNYKSEQGESIERVVERLLTTNEPIKGATQLIYTERKDGVKPEHDPRTDRWKIAQKAQDQNAKSYRAKRENYLNTKNNTENKETA